MTPASPPPARRIARWPNAPAGRRDHDSDRAVDAGQRVRHRHQQRQTRRIGRDLKSGHRSPTAPSERCRGQPSRSGQGAAECQRVGRQAARRPHRGLAQIAGRIGARRREGRERARRRSRRGARSPPMSRDGVAIDASQRASRSAATARTRSPRYHHHPPAISAARRRRDRRTDRKTKAANGGAKTTADG